MDNQKTGALIRERRKQKQLTQQQLAQRLHVTDRAVSKWERGLCAPDIATLEPLARELDVTILELIVGERAPAAPQPDAVDSAVKQTIRYSEQEMRRRGKALIRRLLLAVLGVCLAAVLVLPTLNGLLFGNGFAWRCIPAWLCARNAAQALENYDEDGIERYIARADGLYDTLTELREQGVVIRDARADFGRTRLDDMFLFTEMELTVWQDELTYLFTCQGTWRDGKVEWMEIYAPSEGYDGPDWIPQLSGALATYDPG